MAGKVVEVPALTSSQARPTTTQARPRAARTVGIQLATALVATTIGLAPSAAYATVDRPTADRRTADRPAADAAVGTDAGIDARAAGQQVHHRSWSNPGQLGTGRHRGTRVVGQRLTMAETPPQRIRIKGKRFDRSRWVSGWVSPGFAATEILPSWNARTPGKSRIKIAIRARSGSTTGSWDTVAVWTAKDKHFKRKTRSGQSDDLGRVNVDTWVANAAAGVTQWRIRVVFLKKPQAKKAPAVTRIGATASGARPATVATSAPGPGAGRELRVPRYSQMIHRGHYPKWGGGGEAWCSPTATSMVLGYYGRLPKPGAYAWVGSGHADGFVDHAARHTYDYAYRGAGNWPFNTAYAGTRMGDQGNAFVTRLRSLREAEEFIAAGIPLVTSISFGSGQLSGAPISSTPGHLVVVIGFASNGDVIVNDPAAPNNATVRRVYRRAQFEQAWQRKSAGLTYVIHDAAHPLPPSRGNW